MRQMSSGFIKADRTKHVSPHIFGFTQDLVDQKQLSIVKIESEKNIADMLTKALPAYKHKKLVYAASVSHKPPPLSVVIRVRAGGSHTLA